jgi:hypothetical protein
MNAIQTVITGNANLVIFAIAILLGIIAICVIVEGGIRRKK